MSVYEIESPYAVEDVDAIKMVADHGALYLFHRDYPPYRLLFEPPATWTLEPIPFEWGPFLDENVSDVTITPSGQYPRMKLTGTASASGTTVTGGGTAFTTELHVGDRIRLSDVDAVIGPYAAEERTVTLIASDTELTIDSAFTGTHTGEYIYRTYITLTASHDLFAEGHEGALWQLGGREPGRSVLDTLDDNESGRELFVGKGAEWSVTTTGTFSGVVRIERSYDERATWELVASVESDNFTEYSGEETYDNALYRITMVEYASGSCEARLTVREHIAYGYVEIAVVLSATVALAAVRAGLPESGATTRWSEGAWSDVRGWPRAGGLIEGRLAPMATQFDPTTIWLSHTGQYHNMRVGSTAADAKTFTFATGTGDPFLWIHTGRLSSFVGTESAVLEIAAADVGAAISNTNPLSIVRRVDLGACDIQPVMAHSTLLYVGADRRRIMGTHYEWQQDRLLSPDMAFDCPGLTEPGIKEMALQPTPFPILWLLRTDGVVLGMTYEERPDHTIVGWHRHDGPAESIAVLPGPEQHRLWLLSARPGADDVAWHVERTDAIGGEHRLRDYIEYLGEEFPIAAIHMHLAWIEDEGGHEIQRHIRIETADAHGFEEGDPVSLRGCDGAPWMNASFLVRLENPHNATYGVADPNRFWLGDAAGILDTRGLAFNVSYLPPYQMGAACGTFSDTFTGLDHLEGQEIYAWVDGALQGPFVVADGTIELEDAAVRVAAGRLPNPSILQPLRLVLPTRSGSTRAHQVNIPGVWISLYRTAACKVGRDLSHLETLPIAGLTTDDFFVRIESGFSDDPQILIVQDQPTPCTVRCLMLDAAIHGVRSLPG